MMASDFAAFHTAVHGRPPFDWQQRLVKQIVGERCWPRVLDLPTGAGKTTCLDIALFALALDAKSERPWCARRIAMVVDRRVVVDQVAERGRQLANALLQPTAPIVEEVAASLRSLSHEAAPLAVYTLRGGMPKDDGWARTPDQPLIIASTVDQLGSRLLMQGYGVSAGMAPVHAGLVGNDTLILLDEVHLSGPFAESLEYLRTLRTKFTNTRFQCAFLSATPIGKVTKPFKLSVDDTSEESVLGKRLRAPKPATLEEANGRGEVEKRCVEHAKMLLAEHRTVAVVLNRVASALTVAKQLKESLKGTSDVELLTGRMRPLDRDDLLQRMRRRIMAGRERAESDKPLVVVATQCIEAGADFDFDALVSEAASLSSIRQRFGRVDRLGNYGKARGVIIRDKTEKDDAIYGKAIAETFAWLKERLDKKKRTFDFSPLHFPKVDETDLAAMQGPEKHAPVMLPAYLDLWAQTKPAPALVPEVSLFLHGPESGPADIQVVWRTDLDGERSDEELTEIVSAIRPSSLEAVSVPFAAAKRWLGSKGPTDAPLMADVEGGSEDSIEVSDALVFRWKGDDSGRVKVRELRPGDTVIVPSSKGGLWAGCFDPTVSLNGVPDLAERAALMARGRTTLRLHPAVLRTLGLPQALADDIAAAREQLQAIDPTEPWMKPWLERLQARGRSFVVVAGDAGWSCLDGGLVSRDALRALQVDPEGDATSDEEESSFLGRPVPLKEHSEDVQNFARQFAKALRLPKNLEDDLALAGWLHDIGKADSRFQLMLRRGDAIEFFKDETLWAKSGLVNGARYEQQLAQRKSGYPKGMRHEVQSVAMLEAHLTELKRRAHDLDLVLHLVASHHGHCRPFAPSVMDAEPVDVALEHGDWAFGAVSSNNQLHRLDSAIGDRFWKLNEKYGWLELCWFEAILRLADHRASEAEQEGAAT
jgi:CRISPR-associated endonuclease/helicase Cas3